MHAFAKFMISQVQRISYKSTYLHAWTVTSFSVNIIEAHLRQCFTNLVVWDSMNETKDTPCSVGSPVPARATKLLHMEEFKVVPTHQSYFTNEMADFGWNLELCQHHVETCPAVRHVVFLLERNNDAHWLDRLGWLPGLFRLIEKDRDEAVEETALEEDGHQLISCVCAKHFNHDVWSFHRINVTTIETVCWVIHGSQVLHHRQRFTTLKYSPIKW